MELMVGNCKINLFKSTSENYVIFVHGMCETYEGYIKIKDYLVDNGYNVILYNQRGHGMKVPHLENFEAHSMVEDLLNIELYLRKQLKASFVAVVGHSMGTLVVRSAMKSCVFDRVVLNGMAMTTSKPLAFISSLLFLGNNKKMTTLMDKTVFASYSRKVNDNSSNFSWVCSNEEYMKMYLNDPHCGNVGTKGYYREIIRLTSMAFENSIKPTKVLLTTGSSDPVTNFGKTCEKSKARLEKCGCDVSYIMYDNMRHFIYDEVACEKCYVDLKKFLGGC